MNLATTAFVDDGTGKSVQRFGAAQTSSGDIQRFELGVNDVLTNWIPRCEQSVTPTPTSGFKQGERFWHAIEIWADDWANTNDDQVVLQWHQNDPRLSQNPPIAAVLRNNKLNMQFRSNAANPAPQATNKISSSGDLNWKPKQWNTLIIQGVISPNQADAPSVKIWLNGVLVVNRSEPIGYALQAGSYYYPKWGVYKWTSQNTWNTAVPIRTIMVRNVLVARDPTAIYDYTAINRALLTK